MQEKSRRIYTIRPQGRLNQVPEDHPIGRGPAAGRPSKYADAVPPRRPEPQHPLPPSRSQSGARQIEVNLHLPRLRLPSPSRIKSWVRRRIPGFVSGRFWVFAAGGLIVLAAAYVGARMLHHTTTTASGSGANGQRQSVVTSLSTHPSFATVLPAGKTIDKLGGWGLVSPPGAAPAYAYSDMLSNVHIVVSEQQLPSGFAADPSGQLAKVAQQFGSSQKLSASDGTTVYISAAGNGVQAVVAAKQQLLILIRSSGQVATPDWLSYIKALQ